MFDFGYGGEDFGVVGKYCICEKDVVLQIVCCLWVLIDKEGNMKVYMICNEDVFILLKVCVVKVQKQCVDLFVLIYVDVFISCQFSGFLVFVFFIKGVISIVVKYFVQMQNVLDLIGGVSKSGDCYVDYIMFDMVQFFIIVDSFKFGKVVLEKMGNINNLYKNWVEQVGFVVLKVFDIFFILVEMVFISNVEEEWKLKMVKFQQEVVELIFVGIKVYFVDGVMLVCCG